MAHRLIPLTPPLFFHFTLPLMFENLLLVRRKLPLPQWFRNRDEEKSSGQTQLLNI